MAELTDAQIDERIRRYHDVACGYQRERDAALGEMLKWSQDVVRLNAQVAALTAALAKHHFKDDPIYVCDICGLDAAGGTHG